MKVTRGVGLLYVVAALLIVLFGCHVMLAECRQYSTPEVRASQILHNTSSEVTVVDSTSVDERKLTLKFCTTAFWGKTFNFCCQNQRLKPVCYDTMKECQANCPACDPECPPWP